MYLQPIRSKYTFFADFSPGCEELRKKDTAEWNATYNKLQVVLRQAATEAHLQRNFTDDEKKQFFISGKQFFVVVWSISVNQ